MQLNEIKELLRSALDDAVATLSEAAGSRVVIKTSIAFYNDKLDEFSEYEEGVDSIGGNLSVYRTDDPDITCDYAILVELCGTVAKNESEMNRSVLDFGEDMERLAELLRGKDETETVKILNEEMERIDRELDDEVEKLTECVNRYQKVGVLGIVGIAAILVLLIILASFLK